MLRCGMFRGLGAHFLSSLFYIPLKSEFILLFLSHILNGLCSHCHITVFPRPSMRAAMFLSIVFCINEYFSCQLAKAEALLICDSLETLNSSPNNSTNTTFRAIHLPVRNHGFQNYTDHSNCRTISSRSEEFPKTCQPGPYCLSQI